MYLNTIEARQVTLLCFAQTIIATLALEAKNNSRRQNRLNAALANINQADLTFNGYLPDAYQQKAEQILAEVEDKIVALVSTVPDVESVKTA